MAVVVRVQGDVDRKHETAGDILVKEGHLYVQGTNTYGHAVVVAIYSPGSWTDAKVEISEES